VRAGVEAAAARAKPKSTGLHLRKTSRPAAAAAAAGSGAAEGDEVERTMAEIHAAEVWDDKPNWFFLQVKPSCEKSCSISISNMARSLEHVDIREVLVPTTQTMRLAKSGKSVKKEERLFPGYILVNMVMDRQTYNDVRQVTNIQWFMNDPNREKPKDAPFRPPIPVSVEEMRGIFARIRDAESAVPEVKTQFRPGDLVRVASGAHTGSEGTVVEVKPDLDTITTTLVVFGHETPVELQLNQVELVTSAAELNPPKKRGRKARAALEADAREAALSDRPAPVLIPVDPDGDVRGDGDGDDDSDSDSGDDECGDLDVDGDDGDHDGFEEAETE
jgi:transcription termination/antitermination protein NusG